MEWEPARGFGGYPFMSNVWRPRVVYTHDAQVCEGSRPCESQTIVFAEEMFSPSRAPAVCGISHAPASK
jgi:hypothetical protein